jgi:hypothetical protein
MSRDEAKLVLMKEAGNDDNINDSSSLNKQQKHKEELEEFLLSIYEYWKSKRLSCVITINENNYYFKKFLYFFKQKLEPSINTNCTNR